MSEYKRGQKIEIEWIDAVATGGWGSPEEKREEALKQSKTATIGYVISDDDESIHVAQNAVEGFDRVADTMWIPKTMIRAVHLLRRQ